MVNTYARTYAHTHTHTHTYVRTHLHIYHMKMQLWIEKKLENKRINHVGYMTSKENIQFKNARPFHDCHVVGTLVRKYTDSIE